MDYYKVRDTEHYDYPQLCIFQDKTSCEDFVKKLNEKDEIKTEKNVIYVHIPFCERFCIFCNYYKDLCKTGEAVDAYCDALRDEISAYGRMLPSKLRTITAIHFGGGTPSVLSGNAINRIIATIKEYFVLEDGCTISLEGNVRNFAQERYMSELVETPVNRLSFGVQCFDPDIRKKYTLCDIDNVYKTFENVKKMGISDYNADLMCNFPEQTPQGVIEDIQKVMAHGVKTFDLYSLNVFPNTYMEYYLKNNGTYEKYLNNKKDNVFKEVYDWISKDGNIRPVMSNTFSKEKDEPYAFLKYHLGGNKVDGGSVIGFGASARGYIDGIAYKNHVNIADYIDAIKTNMGIAVNLAREIDDQERRRRTLVMFPNFTSIKSADFCHDEETEEIMERLVDNDVIQKKDDVYYIKVEDCYWAGNISAEFYSKEQKARMAKSLLLNMKNGLNMYNQDEMIIRKKGDKHDRSN